MKIGFIGTGIMGSRMAANLQKDGHTLTVHNRTKDKTDALVEAGAAWADTPAGVTDGAEVVITMLAHPEAVRETALGEGGFLAAMSEGSIWADCSTVNPSFSREMAAAATAHGVQFLDAPVGGSKGAAADAKLLFLVGGPDAAVQTCQPLFDAMGAKTIHAGEHGMGTGTKILINHLLATSMVAFAEALTLGEAMGIPRERLLNTLIGTAVVPAYMAGKREKLAGEDDSTDFPLRWMQKDLQMAAVTAYENGVAMPVSGAAKDVYQLAVRGGYGDADLAAIFHYLNATQDR